MKRPLVFLVSMLTVGAAVPAHAFVFAVGDYLLGGSWGQKFRFESSDANTKKIERVQFTLYKYLSTSHFEATPEVLRNFDDQQYQERRESTSTHAEAERKPGEQGAGVFAVEVWFDDINQSTSPSDVAFRCDVDSKDSSGSVETEHLNLEFHDRNHNGNYADDHWEFTAATGEVPEPGTTVLLGMALGVGGLLRWRRRRSA